MPNPVPQFFGVWCPQDGTQAVYRVHDDNHEVEKLVISTARSGKNWKIRLDYTGLDSHSVEETLSDEAVLEVRAGEPGVPMRKLDKSLWTAGGKPLQLKQAQKVRDDKHNGIACEVWTNTRDSRLTFELWISKQISPFGLVRFRTEGLDLVLDSYTQRR